MKFFTAFFAIVITTIQLFASDPARYTTASPPVSTDNDSIVFYRADRYAMGRKVLTSDLQVIAHSLIHRSDTTFFDDSTGFCTFDGTRLVFFVGDTVNIPFLKADTLLGSPLLKTTATDSMGLVTKQYVDEAISGIPSSYQDTTTYTHSWTEGQLVVNIPPASTWGLAVNTAVANSTGTLGIALSGNKILLRGIFTTTGLTAGTVYYVGGTAGAITTTQPAQSTGHVVRIIGRARVGSTTQLNFNPQEMYGVWE